MGEAARVARLSGDVANAPMLIGQDAGLIDAVLPAAEVIHRMVAQAEEIITGRLRPLLRACCSAGCSCAGWAGNAPGAGPPACQGAPLMLQDIDVLPGPAVDAGIDHHLLSTVAGHPLDPYAPG